MTRTRTVALAFGMALAAPAMAAKTTAPAKPKVTPAAPVATAADAEVPRPVAPAAPAKAKSYEELRTDATFVSDLGTLVEPLLATCTAKEDLARRQCEGIKNWLLARLKQQTYYAVAEHVALQQQPYDATAKTLTLAVNGCLRCAHPPSVDGAPRLLATRLPKGTEDGVPVGIDVGSYDLPFDSAEKAAFWTQKVRPRLRVEFLFNVGQPFDGPPQGVSINLIGHRVYNMCTGEVVASEPPSNDRVTLDNRDPSCPAAGALSDEQLEAQKAEDALPDGLSRQDVQRAMMPVQKRIYECGEEFELKQGDVRVHVTVQGNGSAKMVIAKPYDEGDAHLCIRAALNEASFPHFKSTSPPLEIEFPFRLRN